jgi:hypothetical protein
MELETTSKKPGRGMRVVMAGLATLLLAALALYSIHKIPVAFERARWLGAGEEGDWRIRTRMAEDLISRKLILGKTRREVVAMLGEPEKYLDIKENQLYYTIREEWSGVDPVRIDNLLITTDKNDRAATAVITVFIKINPGPIPPDRTLATG